MTTELISVEGLSLEELAEMANRFGGLCEQAAKKTVRDAATAGAALLQAKELSGQHGKWMKWKADNWKYSDQTASTYMTLAANFKRLKFDDFTSIRSALRAITEQSDTPRDERKPGQVKVIEPGQQPGQQSVQADAAEPDPDPTPAKPTNRKTTAATTKPKEADKRKTQPLVPEILDEPVDAVEAFDRAVKIIDAFVVQCDVAKFLQLKFSESTDESGKKMAAKQLRKLADKLDPPTKFVKPDGNDLLYFLEGYATTDEFMAEHGSRTPSEVKKAADGFMDHYQSNGWMVGKVTMKDWRATARKWLKNQGQFAGKANGNGNGTSKTQESGSCLGANGRPRVERAKITYK